MSDRTGVRGARWLVYGLAGLLFACEAAVVWLMLHPNVPPAYRAYYIDHTTTCLDQPVSGVYRLGDRIDFTSGPAAAATRELRICGWEGPVGNGLHAVGTSSRLRFVFPPDSTAAYRLVARLAAVTGDNGVAVQRVSVRINGQPAATWSIDHSDSREFSAPIPPAALAMGHLEVEFDYPDALAMRPKDPDTRRRSVRLLGVGLVER